MNVLLLLLGLALITLSAQFLVDGSMAVAKKYRMPEFLIGLTIAGIGTSMPELVVSLVGTLEGKGDVAIGNVVGSNLANTLLILGATALIRPIPVSRITMRRDIPFNIFSNLLLLFFCFGIFFWRGEAGVITRFEGVIFLLMFIIFIWNSFRFMEKTPEDTSGEPDGKTSPKMWLASVMIAGGIAGLIYGGQLFVGSAVNIAHALGVSDSFIAITILALGTSLPELATAIVAAIKGKTQFALGNIIGSNIFNICLILGVSATVRPLETGGITLFDVLLSLLAVVLLLLSGAFSKNRSVNKIDGIIALVIYVGYIWMLSVA